MSSRGSVEAFVLVGGTSSRMRRDKALLPIGGVPILVRTARVLEAAVSQVRLVGDPGRYGQCGFQALADVQRALGPLGGILTALTDSAAAWSLVVACDLPYLTDQWIAYLRDRALHSTADVVMPQSEAGGALRPEPLCAAYHARCRGPIEQAVARGVRKITDALEGLRIEWIAPAEWKPFDSHGTLFKNMNTPEDYEGARRLLGRVEAQQPK